MRTGRHAPARPGLIRRGDSSGTMASGARLAATLLLLLLLELAGTSGSPAQHARIQGESRTVRARSSTFFAGGQAPPSAADFRPTGLSSLSAMKGSARGLAGLEGRLDS